VYSSTGASLDIISELVTTKHPKKRTEQEKEKLLPSQKNTFVCALALQQISEVLSEGVEGGLLQRVGVFCKGRDNSDSVTKCCTE
jgi:hypothetical protein